LTRQRSDTANSLAQRAPRSAWTFAPASIEGRSPLL